MKKVEDYSWFEDYREYIHLREKGLRQDAFKRLESFINKIQTVDKTEKRLFIDWVYNKGYNFGFPLYMPENLCRQFLHPELAAWLQDEPENYIPYKWSGDLELMRRSIRMNPNDQMSLAMYAKRIINGIQINQHEIDAGFGYNGLPEDDLEQIAFINQYIASIKDGELRGTLRSTLQELQAVAIAWIGRK